MLDKIDRDLLRDSLLELADFAQGHASLFAFSNVRSLADGRLDKLSQEWRGLLHSLQPGQVIQYVKDEAGGREGDVLRKFLRQKRRVLDKAKTLLSRIEDRSPTEAITKVKGLTPKKAMEVQTLSNLIRRLSEKQGLTRVVDVGCGLGHLSLALASLSIKVVAVEADAELCSSSKIKMDQDKDHDRVMLVRNKVAVDAVRLPDEVIEALDEGEKVILVGLHACGDLGPTLLRVAEGDDRVAAVVLVSCCYHKMTMLPDNANMSGERLHQGLSSPPCLRLACQESLDRWMSESMSEEELIQRARCIGYRAALEQFCHSKRLRLKKKRRRGVRKNRTESASEYVDQVVVGYTFLGLDGEQVDGEGVREELLRTLRECSGQCVPLLNLYIVQLAMQEVLEYLILLDRCLFMLNSGWQVSLAELFDPCLSPRNKVILCLRT